MKQSNLSRFGLYQQKFIYMKRILVALTFVGILATCVAGYAQSTPPANDAPATPAAAPANDVAPPPAAPDAASAAPATAPAAAPAAEPAAANPATPAAEPAAASPATPAAENSAPPAQTPASDAPVVAANDKAPGDAATNAPAADPAKPAAGAAQPGTPIPLIVMDDVPLTDAIRNLARQAGINYLLDPKIGFGQVGPDGKTTPQPSVSLRWENVTPEQALVSLLNNYSLQLVEDPKSKIGRVTIKDPAAPPPLTTKIIQLKYAPPSNVVASAQSILTDKRSKVVPDVRTSQLVVVATEQEMVAVDELVASLDLQPKQVLIEARILETTVNPKTAKGIDWSGTLAAQHVVGGNNALPGVPGSDPTTAIDANGNVVSVPGTQGIIGGILSDPKLLMSPSQGPFFNPSTFFLNADGVSAVISFLNQYSEVREISSPRSVTLDNEKSTVEVGMLYPIVNVTAGTSQTTGGSQITYSNLTIRLEVTPRISANDFVNLMVTPSITKLGPQFKSKVAGTDNTVDSFLTRNVTTKVLVPSGNTLVMGGLIQDQINTGNVKVPILGDIPVLGYLFRSDTKDRNKTDLVLFITPTIVQDQDYQPTQSDFLKRPVPKSDSLEDDWSAWDSGKPKDWSKKQAAVPKFDEEMGALANK